MANHQTENAPKPKIDLKFSSLLDDDFLEPFKGSFAANGKSSGVASSLGVSHTPAPDIRWVDDISIDRTYGGYLGERNISGVTVRPAPHLASGVTWNWPPGKTGSEILGELPKSHGHSEIIQSSFTDSSRTEALQPNVNGFVNAAISAYSGHHHLKIRPEDVWLAILTQMSCYINTHAEELRGSFVAHEGKKDLVIVYDGRYTRYTVDWAEFAQKIGTMIQDNVVDPELRAWIMPAFSTTTEEDVAIASVVMMASMQAYFQYVCCIICGLPSVTLLGEKRDYEIIYHRLNKPRNYGEEPTQFADLLEPVLRRFIRSFDDPEAQDVKDFWNHILTSWNMGSGSTYYSGWITAFMFWDKDGQPLSKEDVSWVETSDKLTPLNLDGAKYHQVSSDDVPPGFSTVPVLIIDHGLEINAEMLAGSIGWVLSSSGEEIANGEKGWMDTMQPRSGWWIYETVEKKAEELEPFEHCYEFEGRRK